MNFLAHIYLSGENQQKKIGNFIGDWVKGDLNKHKNFYPDEILTGIKMHRFIDNYTDHHPVVIKSMERLRPIFRLHSGIIIDVFYDHFLAKNFYLHHKISLKKFSKSFYYSCFKYYQYLPARVKSFLPYMIASNRLYSYSKVEGIQRALSIMASYTSVPDKIDLAIDSLTNNYNQYQTEFLTFFEDIKIEITSSYNVNF